MKAGDFDPLTAQHVSAEAVSMAVMLVDLLREQPCPTSHPGWMLLEKRAETVLRLVRAKQAR